jgi:hypothetical protein
MAFSFAVTPSLAASVMLPYVSAMACLTTPEGTVSDPSGSTACQSLPSRSFAAFSASTMDARARAPSPSASSEGRNRSAAVSASVRALAVARAVVSSMPFNSCRRKEMMSELSPSGWTERKLSSRAEF